MNMNPKDKIKIPPQIMPTLDPGFRKHTFDEVPVGYGEDSAILEAWRCLGCKNAPCVKGCPVNIDIPKVMKLTAERRFVEALQVIRNDNSLPAVCGRVCPQESQCQKNCTMGKINSPVSIGNIERFLADNYSRDLPQPEIKASNSKKIAIAGSGPGGLACAYQSALYGHKVTVFEALHEPGGVLAYGIPAFRLPRKIVAEEIKILKKYGVEFRMNTIIGKTISVEEILNEFDALYIGTGAGVPSFPGIPGEDLPGVYSANEYLTRANLMHAGKLWSKTPITVGKTTVVIGGGNVAMDAARVALRLGSERVVIAYRRLEADMPVRREELLHAREEGIETQFLISPIEIIEGDKGHVSSIVFRKMRAEEDPEGGRSKIFETNETFTMDCEVVIFATGTSPNPTLTSNCRELEVNRKGCIVVNPETCATNIPHVYAGGDAVSGASTVILAMSNGKTAANAINEMFNKSK
jgi:glutamate synthase (NADPH/NADH) small chain